MYGMLNMYDMPNMYNVYDAHDVPHVYGYKPRKNKRTCHKYDKPLFYLYKVKSKECRVSLYGFYYINEGCIGRVKLNQLAPENQKSTRCVTTSP